MDLIKKEKKTSKKTIEIIKKMNIHDWPKLSKYQRY